MSDDDLAAIRALRDAHVRFPTVNRCQSCEAPWPCEDGKAMDALLAEVDRLTVDFAMFKRDVWRTGIPEAKAAERARIRAAVEGLTQYPGLAFNDPSMRGVFVLRAAVLAAIDGETT